MARKNRTQNRKKADQATSRRKEITSSEDWHEVFAITLGGVGFLILLALISYAPEDFSRWRPSETEGGSTESVSNFIGPVGALVAGGCYFLFGVGSYVLPLVMMGLSVARLFGRPFRIRQLNGSVLALVLSVCCLVEYQTVFFGNLVEAFQLPGSKGGLIGNVLGKKLVVGLVGQPGGVLLASLAYVVSLMVLTGFRPLDRLRALGQWLDQRLLRANPIPASGPAMRTTSPVEEPVTPTPVVVVPSEPRESVEAKVRVVEDEPREEAVPLEVEEISEPPSPVPAAEPQVVDASVVVPEAHFDVEEDPPPRVAPRRSSLTRDYQMPAMRLLAWPEQAPEGANQEELRARQQIIIETLRSFRVNVGPGDITRGPTVTRYELYPERGLSVRKITALEADIALATRAERINILAPIPGKDTVGVEIANQRRVVVGLRELLQAPAFSESGVRLPLALGKDVYGKALIADLASMPHLLLAGATGSGKSVCLNTIIASLLYRFRPDELRLIMIDPKVVEMQVFAKLPHLAVPVVTEPKKVLLALRWCLNEMERRYRLFAEAEVRKLDEYNALVRREGGEENEKEQGELFGQEGFEGNEGGEAGWAPASGESVPRGEEPDQDREYLPHIVVIIDELADLMQVAPADVETSICRLCQKARAAGIHLIVATQSPRADVVTGLIKANIPARIAFQVASGTDSRVILDKTGAERLVGKGDMLFQPPDSPIMVRAQGAFLSDAEVASLVAHWSDQAEPEYDEGIQSSLDSGDDSAGGGDVSDADEDAYRKALALIEEEGKASTSFLQRRMRIGYTRAARIMDLLEERGVVGPAEGAKPREILVADLVQGE